MSDTYSVNSVIIMCQHGENPCKALRVNACHLFDAPSALASSLSRRSRQGFLGQIPLPFAWDEGTSRKTIGAEGGRGRDCAEAHGHLKMTDI